MKCYERQINKHRLSEGLKDHEDMTDLELKAEEEWEEEMKLANECYRREQADPEYRCECHFPGERL